MSKPATTSLGPCVLEGGHVRLEPLRRDHAEALLKAAKESDWSWMSMDITADGVIQGWIERALESERKGLEHPFAVFCKDTGTFVGSTRYLDIQEWRRGVEIGWTWYTSKVWGTVVNPECKFLLMRHAFDDWGAIRVQLKTDSENKHSQAAIAKLGAKFEGRLRNHRMRKEGKPGDSMMYSITSEEWSTTIREALSRRVRSSPAPARP